MSAQCVRRRLQICIESATAELIEKPEACLDAYVHANFNWGLKTPMI